MITIDDLLGILQQPEQREIVVLGNWDEVSDTSWQIKTRASILAVRTIGLSGSIWYKIIKNRFGNKVAVSYETNPVLFDIFESILGINKKLNKRDIVDDVDWMKEGF